jgi:hypothetical protein
MMFFGLIAPNLAHVVASEMEFFYQGLGHGAFARARRAT